jgi:putative ABC transport system permease protein
MRTLWQDLRYGARMLLKRPGFTAIAVLTLALGIGANTAIFSVLDATLFHPLPYERPEQLLYFSDGAGQLLNLFPMLDGGEFMEWREPIGFFESAAAYEIGSANLSDEHTPDRIQVLQVTPGFFPLLRVRPSLGRSFNEDEVRRGVKRLLMLSHGFWNQRFGGDEKLPGKSVRLNGISYTVIGVLPSWFDFQVFGRKPDVFIPYSPGASIQGQEAFYPQVIGRLKDGVTQERAQNELNTIGERLTKARRDEAARNPEKRFSGPIEISIQPHASSTHATCRNHPEC